MITGSNLLHVPSSTLYGIIIQRSRFRIVRTQQPYVSEIQENQCSQGGRSILFFSLSITETLANRRHLQAQVYKRGRIALSSSESFTPPCDAAVWKDAFVWIHASQRRHVLDFTLCSSLRKCDLRRSLSTRLNTQDVGFAHHIISLFFSMFGCAQTKENEKTTCRWEEIMCALNPRAGPAFSRQR